MYNVPMTAVLRDSDVSELPPVGCAPDARGVTCGSFSSRAGTCLDGTILMCSYLREESALVVVVSVVAAFSMRTAVC
jgi:hypothetical protein